MQPIPGPSARTGPYYWYQADTGICRTLQKTIPNLRNFHYFEFASALCKCAATDPDTDGVVTSIMNNVTHSTSLPDLIDLPTFPLESRNYLAKNFDRMLQKKQQKTFSAHCQVILDVIL